MPDDDRPVVEDARSRADLLDEFGPPPNDHTPAWGRLAELSARFDGTLDPIVDPEATDGEPLPAASAAPDAPAHEADIETAPQADSVVETSLTDPQADSEPVELDGDLEMLPDGLIPPEGAPVEDGPLDGGPVESGPVEGVLVEAEQLVDPPTLGDGAAADLPSPDAVEAEPVEVVVVDEFEGEAQPVEVLAVDEVAVEAEPFEVVVDEAEGEAQPIEVLAVDADAVEAVAVVEEPGADVPDVVGNTEMVLSMAAERLASPTDETGDDDASDVAFGARFEVDDTDLDNPDIAETETETETEIDDLAWEQPTHADDSDNHGTIADLEAIPPPVSDVSIAHDDIDLAAPTFGEATLADPAAAGPYFDPTYSELATSDTLDDRDDQMVRGGPRWYRKRISQFGIVLGLAPMVLLGALATLILAIGSGPLSGQLGLLLGTSAAPGLLVAGAPFASSATYPYAAVGSIPLWLLLGWLARRRTLARPIAGWRDYAFQLGWLTLAVIVGAGLALSFAAIRIGGPLLG